MLVVVSLLCSLVLRDSRSKDGGDELVEHGLIIHGEWSSGGFCGVQFVHEWHLYLHIFISLMLTF